MVEDELKRLGVPQCANNVEDLIVSEPHCKPYLLQSVLIPKSGLQQAHEWASQRELKVRVYSFLNNLLI
jgi:hypothetical protein